MERTTRLFDRMVRFFWYIMSLLLRHFISIKDNRVFCWSYNFDKYSDSPQVLTEYLLQNYSAKYEIIWALKKGVHITEIDSRIKVVRLNTFSYLVALYSSKFVVSNIRSRRYTNYFMKKKKQLYLMLWHGAFPLKKIEKDAMNSLSRSYIEDAQNDSKMCDLMVSNSNYYTDIIKNAFWYDGEILEKGVPRNDIFFNKKKIETIYYDIRKQLGFSNNKKIVLYAPTFRKDISNLDYYKINWGKVIPYFEKMLNSEVAVVLKLHPNMSNVKNIDQLVNDSRVYNITGAHDISNYLIAADVMIGDYTSAMFDFAILKKPCFIYAIDYKEYDRGFYLPITSLPFPLADSEDRLIANIINYNEAHYQSGLTDFIDNTWGLVSQGNSCEKIEEWMSKKIQ